MLPIFVVGTGRDHIAPWHSVFELHLLNHGELAFVLTFGGHNHPAATIIQRPQSSGGHDAGIVSGPGIHTHAACHQPLRAGWSGGSGRSTAPPVAEL